MGVEGASEGKGKRDKGLKGDKMDGRARILDA